MVGDWFIGGAYYYCSGLSANARSGILHRGQWMLWANDGIEWDAVTSCELIEVHVII